MCGVNDLSTGKIVILGAEVERSQGGLDSESKRQVTKFQASWMR